MRGAASKRQSVASRSECWARHLFLLDAEPAQVLEREVDAPERVVAGRVLEEVDELEAGAHVVRHGDEVGLAGPTVDAEHEPPDRLGRVRAVPVDVRPRLVTAPSLVDPVRLDQSRERLARQVSHGDGLLQPAHDRRARAP